MEAPYYNTVNLTGKRLTTAQAKADTQDKRILFLCEANKAEKLYPRILWKMHHVRFGPIELTSVRRALNTLIKKGLIEQLKRGEFNCPVTGQATAEIQVRFKEIKPMIVKQLKLEF